MALDLASPAWSHACAVPAHDRAYLLRGTAATACRTLQLALAVLCLCLCSTVGGLGNGTELRYFVYDLPPMYRELGTRSCLSLPCIFGNETMLGGTQLWDTDQFDLPWILYHRFKLSSTRTLVPEEADVFLVPTWPKIANEHPLGILEIDRCVDSEKVNKKMMQELYAQNSLLRNDNAPHYPVSRRHILIDGRTDRLCSYMELALTGVVPNLNPRLRHFARISLERSSPFHADNKWPESTYGKPSVDQGERRNALPYYSYPKAPAFW